ncbi:hypothetical protein BJ508DRAFT_351303 [Ascobolus immersus RN42]|uniref:Uncharacterized protein n=1 Tax=Ascobolus immersus RN42 TaxID=1160509 RepID=A0A3N4HU25_ASCIM|nr:hypothetical protein BJ508DRAFT_351303 [Ascobolus immersus RN42]
MNDDEIEIREGLDRMGFITITICNIVRPAEGKIQSALEDAAVPSSSETGGLPEASVQRKSALLESSDGSTDISNASLYRHFQLWIRALYDSDHVSRKNRCIVRFLRFAPARAWSMIDRLNELSLLLQKPEELQRGKRPEVLLWEFLEENAVTEIEKIIRPAELAAKIKAREADIHRFASHKRSLRKWESQEMPVELERMKFEDFHLQQKVEEYLRKMPELGCTMREKLERSVLRVFAEQLQYERQSVYRERITSNTDELAAFSKLVPITICLFPNCTCCYEDVPEGTPLTFDDMDELQAHILNDNITCRHAVGCFDSNTDRYAIFQELSKQCWLRLNASQFHCPLCKTPESTICGRVAEPSQGQSEMSSEDRLKRSDAISAHLNSHFRELLEESVRIIGECDGICERDGDGKIVVPPVPREKQNLNLGGNSFRRRLFQKLRYRTGG